MQALALDEKCGGLAARRPGALVAVSARAAWSKNPCRSRRPARATPVNPAPVSQRNSRRVRPQNWLSFLPAIAQPPSVHVNKLVQVQDDQAERLQSLTPGLFGPQGLVAIYSNVLARR